MTDRAVGNVVGAAFLFCCAVLFWWWAQGRGGILIDYNAENEAYASTYFSELVEFDTVLASQRWHVRGAEAWDCSFAVVTLSDNAADAPPTRDRTELGWHFEWGGAWAPTPAYPLQDYTRDAIRYCARRLPDGVGALLVDIMSGPGSFAMVGSGGETVDLYSPEKRIAAHIRYGD